MKYLPLALAAATVTLTSCVSTGLNPNVAAYRAFDVPASLPTNPSAVRVKVSISNQAVYVMEGDKPLMVAPVSVGTSGSPTPKGNFRIFNKEHEHRANTHGYSYNGNDIRKGYLSQRPSGWNFKGTPMPYWCEFSPAYGFHTGWMKPYPCTRGCLRMHENVSPKFYRLVSHGTPVNIANSQPEDRTIGRNLPHPPDAQPLPDYLGTFYLGDGYFTHHKSPNYR